MFVSDIQQFVNYSQVSGFSIPLILTVRTNKLTLRSKHLDSMVVTLRELDMVKLNT